jgi:predicted metal-binding protein
MKDVLCLVFYLIRPKLYQMKNETLENPFATWMARHKMTVRAVALALGCSNNAVLSWQKKTPPKYVLLACAAYSHGLTPIQ